MRIFNLVVFTLCALLSLTIAFRYIFIHPELSRDSLRVIGGFGTIAGSYYTYLVIGTLNFALFFQQMGSWLKSTTAVDHDPRKDIIPTQNLFALAIISIFFTAFVSVFYFIE
jgi:small neutral amino acid transporter SnatA (MarC family)